MVAALFLGPECGDEGRHHEGQKRPEVGEHLADVMSAATEHCEDGIADHALEGLRRSRDARPPAAARRRGRHHPGPGFSLPTRAGRRGPRGWWRVDEIVAAHLQEAPVVGALSQCPCAWRRGRGGAGRRCCRGRYPCGCAPQGAPLRPPRPYAIRLPDRDRPLPPGGPSAHGHPRPRTTRPRLAG